MLLLWYLMKIMCFVVLCQAQHREIPQERYLFCHLDLVGVTELRYINTISALIANCFSDTIWSSPPGILTHGSVKCISTIPVYIIPSMLVHASSLSFLKHWSQKECQKLTKKWDSYCSLRFYLWSFSLNHAHNLFWFLFVNLCRDPVTVNQRTRKETQPTQLHRIKPLPPHRRKLVRKCRNT